MRCDDFGASIELIDAQYELRAAIGGDGCIGDLHDVPCLLAEETPAVAEVLTGEAINRNVSEKAAAQGVTGVCRHTSGIVVCLFPDRESLNARAYGVAQSIGDGLYDGKSVSEVEIIHDEFANTYKKRVKP